ncbi:hypothetical protein TARUN_8050, partial [Trichoderma arundinaceum]
GGRARMGEPSSKQSHASANKQHFSSPIAVPSAAGQVAVYSSISGPSPAALGLGLVLALRQPVRACHAAFASPLVFACACLGDAWTFDLQCYGGRASSISTEGSYAAANLLLNQALASDDIKTPFASPPPSASQSKIRVIYIDV